MVCERWWIVVNCVDIGFVSVWIICGIGFDIVNFFFVFFCLLGVFLWWLWEKEEVLIVDGFVRIRLVGVGLLKFFVFLLVELVKFLGEVFW